MYQDVPTYLNVQHRKCALAHPLLKKRGLQIINKNFRPVRNLQLISKLTETAVATQIQCQMVDKELPMSRKTFRMLSAEAI